MDHLEPTPHSSLSISDFDYDLPQELIAQTPIEPRDSSRLLVIDRATRTFTHRHFHDIGDFLRPGDLLIANQSRVIPARLLGRRAETGGHVEVLLLAERLDLGPDTWETLVRPGRRLREGSLVEFGPENAPARLQGEILDRTEAGGRVVRFSIPNAAGEQHVDGDSNADGQHRRSTQRDQQASNQTSRHPTLNVAPDLASGVQPHNTQPSGVYSGPSRVRYLIDDLGKMPLPPYIHEELNDPERYQTVYSRISGSAAAPTAGLHFTPELLERLRGQGVRVGFVTLHVGLDTFRPVEVDDFREHKMHSEEIDMDEATAELIQQTRRKGGRVIAVGTTAVRVLESTAALFDGQAHAYHGATRLYITPGHRYKLVDGLITNFHLPRSTLLLLVSALATKSLMEEAYQEAIREQYRFFSFGDAMLIL